LHCLIDKTRLELLGFRRVESGVALAKLQALAKDRAFYHSGFQ
jgi:hypothetical protein